MLVSNHSRSRLVALEMSLKALQVLALDLEVEDAIRHMQIAADAIAKKRQAGTAAVH